MATLEEQIAEVQGNPAFEEFKTQVSALTNLNPENEAQLTELKAKLAEYEAAKAAGTTYEDKAPEPTPEQKAAADKAAQDKEKVTQIVKEYEKQDYYNMHNLANINKELNKQLEAGKEHFEKDFANIDGLDDKQIKDQGKEEDKKRFDEYMKKQEQSKIIKQEIEYQTFKEQKNPSKETYLKDVAEWEERTGVTVERKPGEGMGVAFKTHPVDERQEFEKFQKPREEHRDTQSRIEFANSGYNEILKSKALGDKVFAKFLAEAGEL